MTADTPVIDVWGQHPTRDFFNHDMFESLRDWMGASTMDEEIPTDWTIQAYEGAGVSKSLLTAWHGPEGPILPNDAVAEIVSERPDLFAGVGCVPLDDPMAAVREVRRCVEELGFVGIRIIPWVWDLPPDDRRYYPVYAECVEQDVPFCLQVGHTGPLRPSEPGRPIPYLDHVALEFPELDIVAGHIGHPWTEEMVTLARKYDNVYIDTSAYKPKRFPDELLDYMRADGADKVMFGTNYPMIQPGTALDGVPDLDLDDDTEEQFRWKNAAEVFDLEVDA